MEKTNEMSEEKSKENLVIIGSGPAGLAAGIYASRAGLKPLVIEGMLAGGQLTKTDEVENYPGFENPQTGLSLMAAMRAQAERAGVRFEMDEISSVDFSSSVKRLSGMMGDITSDAVIVATGAGARWTNLPGEDKYKNKFNKYKGERLWEKIYLILIKFDLVLLLYFFTYVYYNLDLLRKKFF